MYDNKKEGEKKYLLKQKELSTAQEQLTQHNNKLNTIIKEGVGDVNAKTFHYFLYNINKEMSTSNMIKEKERQENIIETEQNRLDELTNKIRFLDNKSNRGDALNEQELTDLHNMENHLKKVQRN